MLYRNGGESVASAVWLQLAAQSAAISEEINIGSSAAYRSSVKTIKRQSSVIGGGISENGIEKLMKA
jgi:hypothetical protein